MPLFSVVMPSYLGMYANAAKNRIAKFHRAVESYIAQTFKDSELIIVSDGCTETEKQTETFIKQSDRIKLIKIEKQPVYSGIPRNKGIEAAQGEFIAYLDTDDWLAPNHLESIAAKLNGYDWVWFDDYVYAKNKWFRRECNVNIRFKHGTSNICHKKSLNVQWTGGYEHDFEFVQKLKKTSLNYTKINAGGYYVCHIPGRYDV
jgi:glycosyltransferase involved in cell wall biosynthesis